MRKLILILFVLGLSLGMQAQKINTADAQVLMAGLGGTDKFVSTGAEITFDREIVGFSVAGTTNIVISSIKEGNRGETGEEATGKYNYLDNAVTLKPGETYIFSSYVIKMTFTSGGEILVNYKR